MKKNIIYYFDKSAIIFFAAAFFTVFCQCLYAEPFPDIAKMRCRKNPQDEAFLDKLKIANISRSVQGVKMVYLPGNDIKMPEIKFVKGRKTLLSVKSENGRLCFMKELWADKNNNRVRLVIGDDLPNAENFDFRTQLLDLHGNNDFRYLFIADLHSGNSPSGHIGYIIDVKKNFKTVCKVDAGETVDLPYTTDKLVFTKQVLYLGYFGASGEASVFVKMRYSEFNELEILPCNRNYDDFASHIRNLNNPEAEVTFIYACFIEKGMLKNVKNEVLKAGYPPHIINKIHAEVIEKIKKSPYRKIIEKLNDIDTRKF